LIFKTNSSKINSFLHWFEGTQVGVTVFFILQIRVPPTIAHSQKRKQCICPLFFGIWPKTIETILLFFIQIPRKGQEKNMTNHSCNAVVIRCIDNRLHEIIAALLKKINVETYDLVSIAGATKDHVAVVQQIQKSVELHDPKRVILIHHEDCGAYGSVPLETHINAMKIIKIWIERTGLGVEVECYFLHLNGEFELVA